MKPPKNEKEELIKLEVPELTVEWEDSDSYLSSQEVNEPNDTSLHSIFSILQWKFKKRRVLRLVTFLILLCCVLGSVIYLHENRTATIATIDPNQLSTITVQNLVINNEDKILILDEAGSVLSIQNRVDIQDLSCFLLKDQVISWQLSYSQNLGFITSNGYQLVATDVTSFVQSNDGYDVYYVKINKTKSDLYHFDYKTGRSTLIDSNVMNKDYCVSPDGKFVAYLQSTSWDDESLTQTKCSIFKQDSGIIKNIVDILPIALSNNLDYFYYVKNKNLYVQTSQGLITQLQGRIDSPETDLILIFNVDHTELQYQFNYSWYLSSKGSSGSKVHGYYHEGLFFIKPYGFYFNNWYNIRTIADKEFSRLSTQTYQEEFRDWALQVDQYSDRFVYKDYYLSLKNNQVYLTRFDTWDKTYTNIPLTEGHSVEQLLNSFEHEFFYIITKEKELFKIDYEGNYTYLTDQALFVVQNFVNGKEEFYVVKDSLFDSTDDLAKMTRSTYYFKLYYCMEDNTLKEVEGADKVQMIASSYQISYKDCSKDAENMPTQYYILSQGSGIPIQIPENEGILKE